MNATAPRALIEIDDLTRIYPAAVPIRALDGVTLAVPEGAFLGISGSSGSGKSTLLNILGGLDTPTSGHIALAGRRISDLGPDDLALYRRDKVGMVFQSFNLISAYTALENVAFPLLFAGVARAERGRRAAEALEAVGLAARRSHRPTELSGGEQQRVAIARALINRPKVLLADEPTGNLDSTTAAQILQTLADLNAAGLTIVMISHEEPLLRKYSHAIVRLRDGRIIEHEHIRAAQ
ncbi:MAG: ABC transporter ATP-binding protein [Phycisphaerae bacterium]|nr:ABC transporter ATP-binding protein [Phycisphaerae bacterium]